MMIFRVPHDVFLNCSHTIRYRESKMVTARVFTNLRHGGQPVSQPPHFSPSPPKHALSPAIFAFPHKPSCALVADVSQGWGRRMSHRNYDISTSLQEPHNTGAACQATINACALEDTRSPESQVATQLNSTVDDCSIHS